MVRCGWRVARLAGCVLALLGAGLFGCEREQQVRSQEESRPPRPPRAALKAKPEIRNVILISIDTLRADHLACYGHPFVETPNLDKLAAEGWLFTNHFSAAPSTLTSHTSLLTGCYPHTHGVPKNGDRVSDDNVMLAEVFKEAGFATAAFVAAFPLDPMFNFHQGFDRFDTDYKLGAVRNARDQAQRRADQVTNAVLGWLAMRQSQASDSGLFLFAHYFDVHWPYEAPEPYARMYRTDSDPAVGTMDVIYCARRYLASDNRERGLELSKLLDAEYCAEITYVDAQVGRLLEGLKRYGLYDSSLIVVTSDHGETMHEHDSYFMHGETVYDTEIHTPLLIRFPGGLQGGRRVERLVSNIDVMPTVLHLLDLPEPARMEGVSFAPLLDGPMQMREPVFAEATMPYWDPRFDSDPIWANQDKYQGVTDGQVKYIYRRPDNVQGYFDRRTDPGEQSNLIENDALDDAVYAGLRARLDAWRRQTEPLDSTSLKSEAARTGLESLGYTAGREDPCDE